MKKRLLLTIFLLLLLSGCSQNQESKPILITTTTPKVFDSIGFSEYIPFLNNLFNKLKEQGADCKIDNNQNFDTHICYNITGYDISYTIPQRHLKLKEAVWFLYNNLAHPWVLYPQRNSAFYITGDKVVALPLRKEEMYNNPKNDDVWYSHNFWIDPKIIRELPSYELPSYIQYTPIPKGESVKSTIQKLKTELELSGEVLQETSCDFSNTRLAFYVESGICFNLLKIDEDVESDGEMFIYIFSPDKKYYYKLCYIVGTPESEGFGFGGIVFFTEGISSTPAVIPETTKKHD